MSVKANPSTARQRLGSNGFALMSFSLAFALGLPPVTPARTTTVVEPFATSVRRGTPLLWATGAGAMLTARLGWGERFRAEASGPRRFDDLADAFARFAATAPGPRADVVAFVAGAFADDSAATSVLIVPEVLGTWRGGVLRLHSTDGVPSPSEAAEFEELDVRSGRLTREGFRRAVVAAVRRIEAGEVEKVVLARDLEATAPDPIDVSVVLSRLQEANPDSWTFHVDGLIGSSPELLVSVTGRRVFSQALAGSAIVTGDVHTDDLTATRLAASAKNHAEHGYAARSVVERLATVAHVSAVDPRVLRFPRIMHLATDISGVLHEPLSALHVAGVVHPSAAVCGTPTDVAASVLAELEGFDRGRYAGPVGWVDAAGDGEFAIALRCGQVGEDGRSVRLFAGGGVVAGSVPNEELAETAQKFLAMYEALSPVARP